MVPPNQGFPSISPTVPFVAFQIEDQVAHPAVYPETTQSWSLTWDQFDQLLGSGPQATPTDFDRIDLDSGVPISVGNVDIQSLFDADWRSQPSRPSRFNRPFELCPRMSLLRIFLLKVRVIPLKISPLPNLQARPNPGGAIEQLRIGRKQLAFLLFQVYLMLISFMITPVRRIWTSSPDRDADRYNAGPNPRSSGTRDRDADRYNAGPNPLLSSSTQDRDASRYNAGSNPPSPTSGIRRPDAGRETAGPNPSSTSSRNHAGLFAAFNRRETRKESAPYVIDRPRRVVQPSCQWRIRTGFNWYWIYSL